MRSRRRARPAALRLGAETLERRDMLAATLSASDFSQGAGFFENAGQAIFTIALSDPLTYGVAVRYTTLDRTATLRDGDYVKTVGTAYIPAYSLSIDVPVTLNDDAKYEPDESIALRILSAPGVVISQSTATCTIVNDDPVPVPTVSVSDARTTEGNHGLKMLSFGVALSERAYDDVTVEYQTEDGTALAGYDFAGTAGSITFKPGVTRRTVNVWVVGDTTVERTEQFGLKLMAVSAAATLGRDTGVATIVNDDMAARRSLAAFAMLAAESPTSKPAARRR